jgi:hypothetical protein
MFSAGSHEEDGGKKDSVLNVEAAGEFVYNMATWAQRDQMNRTARGEESLRAVTFVEGWNIRQVRAALAKEDVLKPDTRGLADDALMNLLGRPGERSVNPDEAVALANSVEYGLSGSVWTRGQATALRMVKALDTGIIWVNCMMDGYPQIPVPPHKMSGTGVELGMEGLMAYCRRKSAVIGYDDKQPVGWGL